MNDLLELLGARGFVQDATPGLSERLREGPVTAYAGFDPTADSLHVGNLVPVMGMAWLQRLGHTPIALVGGGTGMVGDPSGKREERPVLSLDQIDRNTQAIVRQLRRFLTFEGANAARLRNNADWLRDVRLMEFLRDTGKHFTISFMLQKESVASRMEVGISYTEFSYMLIQAYDFWHLFRTEGCELQLGGSDQWGNITAGTHLVDRREGRQVHGLVFPLVTTASGAKFGKSESGNVWLDPDRTSPYHFYQFWLNTDDRDVERYLKLFTFLPLDQIARALAEHAGDPSRREAQRVLAREVTATVHGDAAAEAAIQTSAALFTRSAEGAELPAEAIADMPERRVSRAHLPDGLPILEVLVASGLATSKADARRGIQGKGFYLNGRAIDDVELRIGDDVLQGAPDARYLILRKGKKNYVRLVLEA
ncbi:MAG TPA: tyrosine--tRNA ligase [Gemmatimonadales bacterium]|nr:tyrosine--tRNA ligase [Gemmatimonadales bacterium]